MTRIGYASLSGLQVADKVLSMVAHNVANSQTPGFHRYEERNSEMGPFPVVAGVETDIRRTENQFLDDQLQAATMAKDNADIINDAYDQLGKVPYEDLQTSYSKMMEATHHLLRTPDDPIAQEAFNQTTLGFQKSTERYQDRLDQIKSNTNLKVEITTARVSQLESRLQELSKNGTTDPNEINDLKSQLLQATGNLESYRRILSSLVPPVEFAFRAAVDTVHSNINQLSGKDVFVDGESKYVTDFSDFDETRLPEWDSHWFNTEIGRIQTKTGFDQQDAEANLGYLTGKVDDLSAQWDAEFGVDLVAQQVKAMQYQRMYEANAQMIKVQDSIIGTAIDMVAR